MSLKALAQSSLNSFFIEWWSESIPIALKPVQFFIGYADKDEHIWFTWVELPIKEIVKINVTRAININNRLQNKIVFLFSALISKRYIITNIERKKNIPSCINSVRGKKKIKKIIDSSFFFKELIKKIKDRKIIKNKISFRAIAPIL